MSVGGFLKVLAWIALIGGMVGGFIVVLAMSLDPYYGLGIAASSVVWFAVLYGLGEIVEATNKIANEGREYVRMVR